MLLLQCLLVLIIVRLLYNVHHKSCTNMSNNVSNVSTAMSSKQDFQFSA